MSRDELIAAFSLDGISGGAAVFDPEKLDWFNAQYLARLNPDDLVERVKPLLQSAGLWTDELDAEGRREWLQRVLRLVLPRVRRLPEFVGQAAPFLTASVDYDPEAVRKHLTSADLDATSKRSSPRSRETTSRTRKRRLSVCCAAWPTHAASRRPRSFMRPASPPLERL